MFDYYSCYCDGAVKNSGRRNPDSPSFGGTGCVLVNEEGKAILKRGIGFHEKSKTIKRIITNNVMELMAVINGITWFKTKVKDANKKKLIIFSDSEYVVKGINERIRKWIHNDWLNNEGNPVKNRDLWEQILDLMMDKTSPEIKFIHVDGHAGNEFNEMADKLAVTGKELAIKNHGSRIS